MSVLPIPVASTPTWGSLGTSHLSWIPIPLLWTVHSVSMALSDAVVHSSSLVHFMLVIHSPTVELLSSLVALNSLGTLPRNGSLLIYVTIINPGSLNEYGTLHR